MSTADWCWVNTVLTARFADAAAELGAVLSGPASGTPLLLLNGLFAARQSWEPALVHLQDFRVIRYDARGQGQTPPAEGVYRLDQQVDDVVALLDALSVDRCAPVGLSNGGRVALALAARHPDRVCAVVAAHAFANPTRVQHAVMQSWLTAHRHGGGRLRFDVAAPWIWSETAWREHPELIAFYRDRAETRQAEAVGSLINGSLDGRIDLAAVRAPTLLLSAEQDLLTPPYSMRAMAERLPDASLAVVPGAHAALLERPALFAEQVVPFLDRVLQGGTTHVV